jgi:hypothetical protein
LSDDDSNDGDDFDTVDVLVSTKSTIIVFATAYHVTMAAATAAAMMMVGLTIQRSNFSAAGVTAVMVSAVVVVLVAAVVMFCFATGFSFHSLSAKGH